MGDRVWLDFDGDGVQDADEPGLNGVTVTLTWAGPDGNLNTTGDNVLLTTTTDPNGAYLFINIPPGLYSVAVTAGLPPGVTNTGDPDGTFDGQTTLTLGTNDIRTDVDFGYQGSSSLSGFVYRDLSVDGIRQPTGINPETGIGEIPITLAGTDINGNTISRTTVTATDGSYSFGGMLAGDYTITESQPPSVFEAGANGFYDGLDTPGTIGGVETGTSPVKNQLAVTLGTGEDGVEYNFGENPPADPFGFVYIDLNNNGIREPGEPGISGVSVTISGTAFAGTPLARPLTAADVPGGLISVTDDNGLWEFRIVPPGLYSLIEAQPAAFEDGLEEDADPNGPPATVGNDRFDDVELQPFPVRGPFNFGELAVNGSLAGSVYVDTNNNGLRDPGELGIPGVVVTLTGRDLAGQDINLTVVTDAAGNYLFRKMRPGTYTLREGHPGAFMDGQDRVGSLGGTAGNDTITDITVGVNEAGTAYLFGERGLRPESISKRQFLASTQPAEMIPGIAGSGITNVNDVADPSGFVFVDLNENGVRDPGEPGIEGVMIELTGTTVDGSVVYLMQLTDASGFYQFDNLLPGVYAVTQTQPVGYRDGRESLGSLGGVVENDRFSQIVLLPGSVGTDYNFGELPPEPASVKASAEEIDAEDQPAEESGFLPWLENVTRISSRTQATPPPTHLAEVALLDRMFAELPENGSELPDFFLGTARTAVKTVRTDSVGQVLDPARQGEVWSHLRDWLGAIPLLAGAYCASQQPGNRRRSRRKDK